jgi:hypothetical protein
VAPAEIESVKILPDVRKPESFLHADRTKIILFVEDFEKNKSNE